MEPLALTLELLLPLAIGAATARYISTATQPLLLEICRTGVGAAFWTRITSVAVLLVPMALTLAFVGNTYDVSATDVVRRTVLLAIVGTLIAVGAVARALYRRIPTGAVEVPKAA